MTGCALPLALLAAVGASDALSEAEALLKAGEPAKARAVVGARLESAPPAEEKAPLQELLGRCLLDEGRLWDAEAAFAAALEIRPAFPEADLGRGVAFLRLASAAADAPVPSGAEVRALAADAKRWLLEAGKGMPGDLRPLRGLAKARLLDLDFAGAAETVRAWIEKEPRDPEAHHLLAAALRASGDRAAAAKSEAAALDLDPAHREAADFRVRDLSALGDSPGARAAAKEALLRDPANEGVYRALWDAEAAAGRFVAMEEVLLAVLAKHADHPRALHYLGYVQLSCGRRDDALATFRKKAALEPDNPQPRLHIGRILAARDELAEAEKTLEEAVRGLDPEGTEFAAALEALHSVGASHGLARRHRDAERVFRRLTELDPRNPSYRMYLGLSLRRQGRFADAEKAFLEAAEGAPFDGAPLNELGLLYLGAGRIEEARTRFLESAETDHRFTAPLENLGNLARLAGRLDEAVERFREGHRRAASFRDEDDRMKFRRYLDVVAREREAAGR